MRSTWIKAGTFLGVTLAVFLVAGRGLEYRTIWQDEVETAERAKSILDGGLPRVVDPNGNWSLNTGGREIDSGDLHRYTPWFQFYVGAAGLAIGEKLGLSPDASIRLPFFFLHSASSGLAAVLLPGITGVPYLAAAAVATLYGVASVRVIHDRTARYHGLTDFLFFAAWILYGVFRRRLLDGGKTAIPAAALALALSLLVHSHTLCGLLASGFFAALVWLEFPKIRKTYFFVLALVPAVAALILLVQPSEQAKVWGALKIQRGRSLRSWFEIGYAIPFFVFTVLMAFGFRNRARAREILIALSPPFLLALGIRILDFHPYSQTRYYLPIIGALLFWPLAIGARDLWHKKHAGRFYLAILTTMILYAEIGGDFAAFQGVRISAFDATMAKASRKDRGLSQPLRLAFDRIRANGKPGDGVLVEYVPQFVNWYLPEFKPALVPDDFTIAPLGEGNPLLESIPFVEPTWHVYYFGVFEGFWICPGECDFRILHDTGDPSTYRIYSARLDRTYKFCIVDQWPSYHWNNAPFMNYGPEALSASGGEWETITLAKRCE